MKKAILTAAVLFMTTTAFAGNGQVGSVGVGMKTVTLQMPEELVFERIVGNSDGTVSVISPATMKDGKQKTFQGSRENVTYICGLMGLKGHSYELQQGLTDKYILNSDNSVLSLARCK